MEYSTFMNDILFCEQCKKKTVVIEETLHKNVFLLRCGHTQKHVEVGPPVQVIQISDRVVAKVKFESTDGVIVLLDALGIKGIWDRKDPKEVLNNWIEVQLAFRTGFTHLENQLRISGHFEKLRFEALSDTIMISLPVKNKGGAGPGSNPLWWTIMAIGHILKKLFRMAILQNLYFRGCVSAGRFYRTEDASIIIGPAVDEAAEYHTLTEWSGIHTSPSASKIITDYKEMISTPYNIYKRYDIPFKDNVDKNGWALNWPMSEDQNVEENNKLRQKLTEEFKTYGISKIKNTLKFYDSVIQ